MTSVKLVDGNGTGDKGDDKTMGMITLNGLVDKLMLGEHLEKDDLEVQDNKLYTDTSFKEIEGCGSISYDEVFQEDVVRIDDKTGNTMTLDGLAGESILEEDLGSESLKVQENGSSTASDSKTEFEGCGSLAYSEMFPESDDFCDGDVFLDDLGQELICHLEPTEFDKIVAAIEDTIIADESISELQLACVDEYHQLHTESEDSDALAKKKEIFDKYKNGMCAAVEIGVQKVVKDFKTMDFMENLFGTGDASLKSHPAEFEQSEVYELMQSMYDLEAFEHLVADYVFMVNSRDVLSAVKVVPFSA